MEALPYFVRVFVIGLGFMSGFWIAVGVNPEAEIVKAFAEAAESLTEGAGIIFWLIPIVGLISSTIGAFMIGGWLGLVAVGIAFISGLLVICCIIPALILLGAAIGVGIIASPST